MPRPAQGPNSWEAVTLNLPGDSISRRLSCLGICTLTRGCLAFGLQQFWVG